MGASSGASSGCTVLCPHYLRELILFVFSLCLVAIHLCEDGAHGEPVCLSLLCAPLLPRLLVLGSFGYPEYLGLSGSSYVPLRLLWSILIISS